VGETLTDAEGGREGRVLALDETLREPDSEPRNEALAAPEALAEGEPEGGAGEPLGAPEPLGGPPLPVALAEARPLRERGASFTYLSAPSITAQSYP
jgi:hypothetical protein